MLGAAQAACRRRSGASTPNASVPCFIVAREVKRQGICDLSVGQIVAEAGVCTRTVQNAVVETVRQGHVASEERPSGAAST